MEKKVGFGADYRVSPYMQTSGYQAYFLCLGTRLRSLAAQAMGWLVPQKAVGLIPT